MLLTLLLSGLVPRGEEELPPGQVTLVCCVSLASWMTSRPIFTNSFLKPGKSKSTENITLPLVSVHCSQTAFHTPVSVCVYNILGPCSPSTSPTFFLVLKFLLCSLLDDIEDFFFLHFEIGSQFNHK